MAADSSVLYELDIIEQNKKKHDRLSDEPKEEKIKAIISDPKLNSIWQNAGNTILPDDMDT